MTTHTVKSWAHFFDAIKAGNKLHDLRKLDRDYKVGDKLILQRYDNIEGEYTGEELEVEISYITSNKVPCAFSSSALDRDYGIFSLKVINKIEVPDCDNPDISPTIVFDRPLTLIKKGIDYSRGEVAKADHKYIIGEIPSETVYVNPVSPNPNAEYYQNR